LTNGGYSFCLVLRADLRHLRAVEEDIQYSYPAQSPTLEVGPNADEFDVLVQYECIDADGERRTRRYSEFQLTTSLRKTSSSAEKMGGAAATINRANLSMHSLEVLWLVVAHLHVLQKQSLDRKLLLTLPYRAIRGG